MLAVTLSRDDAGSIISPEPTKEDNVYGGYPVQIYVTTNRGEMQ